MVHGHNTAPTWILFKNSEDSSVLKTSFGSKVHVTILHPKNWMAASTERSSAWKPWGHSQKEFCSFSTLLPEVPRHKCFWKVSYRIIFNYTGHTFIIYHQFMANVSWIFHIWRIWEYWSWGESPENTSTGIFHRTNSCPTKNIQQILPTNMVSFSVILGILSTCKQTFVQLDIWYMYIYMHIFMLFAAAASYPSCRHVSPQPRGHASFNASDTSGALRHKLRTVNALMA